jgi:soluble lytic murein transglycosylase-like protein
MATDATQEQRYQLVRSLAAKWGAIWGIDPRWILAIACIESSYHPTRVCRNPRAARVGYAWGLLQITGDTVKTLVRRLRDEMTARQRAISDVTPVLARWNAGNPASLLDPELNVMLGSYYLAKLAAEFGAELAPVAAGYHQGPGKVRDMRRAKLPIPDALPPNGRSYVVKVCAAFDEIVKGDAQRNEDVGALAYDPDDDGGDSGGPRGGAA